MVMMSNNPYSFVKVTLFQRGFGPVPQLLRSSSDKDEVPKLNKGVLNPLHTLPAFRGQIAVPYRSRGLHGESTEGDDSGESGCSSSTQLSGETVGEFLVELRERLMNNMSGTRMKSYRGRGSEELTSLGSDDFQSGAAPDIRTQDFRIVSLINADESIDLCLPGYSGDLIDSKCPSDSGKSLLCVWAVKRRKNDNNHSEPCAQGVTAVEDLEEEDAIPPPSTKPLLATKRVEISMLDVDTSGAPALDGKRMLIGGSPTVGEVAANLTMMSGKNFQRLVLKDTHLKLQNTMGQEGVKRKKPLPIAPGMAMYRNVETAVLPCEAYTSVAELCSCVFELASSKTVNSVGDDEGGVLHVRGRSVQSTGTQRGKRDRSSSRVIKGYSVPSSSVIRDDDEDMDGGGLLVLLPESPTPCKGFEVDFRSPAAVPMRFDREDDIPVLPSNRQLTEEFGEAESESDEEEEEEEEEDVDRSTTNSTRTNSSSGSDSENDSSSSSSSSITENDSSSGSESNNTSSSSWSGTNGSQGGNSEGSSSSSNRTPTSSDESVNLVSDWTRPTPAKQSQQTLMVVLIGGGEDDDDDDDDGPDAQEPSPWEAPRATTLSTERDVTLSMSQPRLGSDERPLNQRIQLSGLRFAEETPNRKYTLMHRSLTRTSSDNNNNTDRGMDQGMSTPNHPTHLVAGGETELVAKERSAPHELDNILGEVKMTLGVVTPAVTCDWAPSPVVTMPTGVLEGGEETTTTTAQQQYDGDTLDGQDEGSSTRSEDGGVLCVDLEEDEEEPPMTLDDL